MTRGAVEFVQILNYYDTWNLFITGFELSLTHKHTDKQRKSFRTNNEESQSIIISVFFFLLSLEDTALHAGLLLAPVEGFGLWPRLFLSEELITLF